jgi:DNA-directed RNA polymerase subunit M/transcription elongation factor TFIIS
MTKKLKQVCTCTKCGNESEMVVTCSLTDVETAEKEKADHKHAADAEKVKVKGTAVCTHCGNEADMWIDL